MKLYTRAGDEGFTSLFDGQRVRKDDPRVEAYGTVDELNSLLGACRAACEDDRLAQRIAAVQDHLFRIGADLATPTTASNLRPKVPVVQTELIAELERWIDEAVQASPPLKTFILPGGTELATRLHVARTTCRRAERRVVELVVDHRASEQVLVYLNRLGDLLFAWARWANHLAGVPDTPWTTNEPTSSREPGSCE